MLLPGVVATTFVTMPAPPTGYDAYNGIILIGDNTTTTYGFNTNTPPNTHGDLDPLAMQGLDTFQFTFQTGTNSIVLVMTTSGQIPTGAGRDIDVDIGTNPTLALSWNGSSYDAAHAGTVSYIVSENGNWLTLGINFGAGGEG